MAVIHREYRTEIVVVVIVAVILGVLGCPNLHVDQERPQGERGCLFLAIRGEGAFQMNSGGGEKRLLSVSKTEDPSEAIVTESVESDHADHLSHQRLARKLNISRSPFRMDSQAKYGIVARGEATLYLRVPSPSEPGYREKIWDHAAGSILTEEAGGKVTDLAGRPLDFAHGIKLERNRGVIVTNGLLHETVLKALEA